MSFLLTAIIAIYALVILLIWLNWRKNLSRVDSGELNPSETIISVVIAMRNEAPSLPMLLSCLERQRYSRRLFEVIFVNDHSTDKSLETVRTFAKNSSLNIRVSDLGAGLEGKKQALANGIELTNGNLLLFTDADCAMGPEWVSGYANAHRLQNFHFAFAGLRLSPAPDIFGKMQQMEMASLVGSGGGTLAMGIPTMCNGANLAYTKEFYHQAKGFESHSHIPSGDDEFMLHKAFGLFPDKVSFLPDPKLLVTTPPAATIDEFVAQRRRWASKWTHYESVFPKVLAIIVFLANLSLLLSVPFTLAGWVSGWLLLFLVGIKVAVDFLMLNAVTRHYGHGLNLATFATLQVTYSAYVVYMALAGTFGDYTWKGRQYST